MSEILYRGLCQKIGSPTELTIRREVLDMRETIEEPVQIHRGHRRTVSGSYGEGFRFQSSDIDFMHWRCHVKLITDVAQAKLYNGMVHSILLMENNDTPIGFVKLKVLSIPTLQLFSSSAYLGIN
jgi:hypothetical protein